MKYFLTILLFAAIDLNLFLGEPIKGVKVYLVEEISNELVAFQKVGDSGKFDFADLDPANYRLYIEVPEHTVRLLDKKQRAKYDTEIEVAYNSSKKSWYWQREDGFMSVNFSSLRKLTEDNVTPEFSREEAMFFVKEKQKSQNVGFSIQSKQDYNKSEPMILVARLSVFDDGGALGGVITGLTQKEFYNRTQKVVFSEKKTEDIQVIKKFE